MRTVIFETQIHDSVIPYHDSWRYLFDSLTEFSDDFMEDREQPKEQTRENIF